MEVYFEQSLQNPNIDKHVRRTRVLSVIRYVCIAVAFILLMLYFNFLPIDNFKTVGGGVITVLFIIVTIAPFVVAFFMIGKLINNTNLEFDYFLSGDTFRVVKVINRKKRKKFIEISVSSFESLGKIESETYDRLVSGKDVKKQYALTDYKDEEKIYYVYYTHEGTKYVLHFQPSNDMIIALRKSVSRIAILDKSFRIMAEDANV